MKRAMKLGVEESGRSEERSERSEGSKARRVMSVGGSSRCEEGIRVAASSDERVAKSEASSDARSVAKGEAKGEASSEASSEARSGRERGKASEACRRK